MASAALALPAGVAPNPVLEVGYSQRKGQPIVVRVDLTKRTDLSGFLRITLFGRDWTRKYVKEIRKPKPTVHTERIKADELPCDDHYLRVSLHDRAGKYLAAFEETFRIPDETKWLGNKIGLSDKVPAPFTPLEAKGQAVWCWGRT